jgi:hypothetical protein
LLKKLLCLTIKAFSFRLLRKVNNLVKIENKESKFLTKSSSTNFLLNEKKKEIKSEKFEFQSGAQKAEIPNPKASFHKKATSQIPVKVIIK